MECITGASFGVVGAVFPMWKTKHPRDVGVALTGIAVGRIISAAATLSRGEVDDSSMAEI
jgi:hypothetical protein